MLFQQTKFIIRSMVEFIHEQGILVVKKKEQINFTFKGLIPKINLCNFLIHSFFLYYIYTYF